MWQDHLACQEEMAPLGQVHFHPEAEDLHQCEKTHPPTAQENPPLVPNEDPYQKVTELQVQQEWHVEVWE